MSVESIETLVLFDKSNPRSLWNLVWEGFQKYMGYLESNHGYWLSLTERDLEKRFTPEVTFRRLRLNFWDEYFYVQEKNKERMVLERICKGICQRDFWLTRVQREPKMACYILNHPVDYLVSQREMLARGLDEMREILERPFIEIKTTKSGQSYESVNTQLIGKKIEIVKMLEERVKGAVVQRIALRQQVDSRMEVRNLEASTDLRVLERQIEDTKRRIEGVRDRSILDIGVRDAAAASNGLGEEIYEIKEASNEAAAAEETVFEEESVKCEESVEKGPPPGERLFGDEGY